MSENGRYYWSVINSNNSPVDYAGLFIYDPTDGTRFTGIIKRHFQTGQTLEFTGVPLISSKEYQTIACTYNHASGMSTFNKAVKINYPGAIENHDGEPVVIYMKLLFSI